MGTIQADLLWSGARFLESGLLEYADTLEELRLEFSNSADTDDNTRSFPPPIHSFAQFTQLRILHVDIMTIIGYFQSEPSYATDDGADDEVIHRNLDRTKLTLLGRLPVSLRELGLYYCYIGGEVGPALAMHIMTEFVKSCGPGKLHPQMRKFILKQFTWPYAIEIDESWDGKELAELCSDAGLEFEDFSCLSWQFCGVVCPDRKYYFEQIKYD
jgi:hypothetical protein